MYIYVNWLNIFYLYGNGTIVYHSREIKWKYILPRQFLPSLVAYPVGHCLWGARGHSSQGLPQATPILPQHSDLVTSALALFSQRPLFISSQHDPFLLSTKHSKLIWQFKILYPYNFILPLSVHKLDYFLIKS